MPDEQSVLATAQAAIREEPAIANPTSVVVTVTKEGPLFRKKMVVKLDGNVRTTIEARKAEEAVRRKLPDLEIENGLMPA